MAKKEYIINNPTLMAEWNFEKNDALGLQPTVLTTGSGKKVWWKCNNGHEWQAAVYKRKNGKGCPYCTGQKAEKGKTDLATINPDLAKEWNHEKNGNLKLEEFLPNSHKKVWWKCKKGHEWDARIASRNQGMGCPMCQSERKTSFPEYAIIYYLNKYGVKAIHSYREKGYELDVYIPSKKSAIEYDGYLWHKNKTKKDLEKNLKCKNDEIKLYRIREGLPVLNDSSIDYVVNKYQKNLSEIIEVFLYDLLGINVDIDIERDAIKIENLRAYTEKADSLLSTNPNLAREWDYEKNGELKPEYLFSGSHRKVWWKCNEGHEYQATIIHRNGGTGCPYCSGRVAIKGKNDLATINPGLAKEWNNEKNGILKPEDFMACSHKKVWWNCVLGHEWQATIKSRNSGTGCPYCSGRYAVKGKNDLQAVNPTLVQEWNYEKNNGLMPNDVLPNSDKKVWWKCSKGHEWQAIIKNRNKGAGCPYCSGLRKGYL